MLKTDHDKSLYIYIYICISVFKFPFFFSVNNLENYSLGNFDV